jgi:hypothetical protein
MPSVETGRGVPSSVKPSDTVACFYEVGGHECRW